MAKQSGHWVRFKKTFKMHIKGGIKMFTIGEHELSKDEFEIVKHTKSICDVMTENEVDKMFKRRELVKPKNAKTKKIVTETTRSEK